MTSKLNWMYKLEESPLYILLSLHWVKLLSKKLKLHLCFYIKYLKNCKPISNNFIHFFRLCAPAVHNYIFRNVHNIPRGANHLHTVSIQRWNAKVRFLSVSCWSSHHSRAPQRGKKRKLKRRKRSNSILRVPILSVCEAEQNEAMEAWNVLMEAACFQPWLSLKAPKGEERPPSTKAMLSCFYEKQRQWRTSLWITVQQHCSSLSFMVEFNWCSYVSGLVKTLRVHIWD